MYKWFGIKVCTKTRLKKMFFFCSRTLTPIFLRELKVLVNQLLGSDLIDDLITLITYLAITRCKKVRVCDEDDDLSLYLLEALVTG